MPQYNHWGDISPVKETLCGKREIVWRKKFQVGKDDDIGHVVMSVFCNGADMLLYCIQLKIEQKGK